MLTLDEQHFKARNPQPDCICLHALRRLLGI